MCTSCLPQIHCQKITFINISLLFQFSLVEPGLFLDILNFLNGVFVSETQQRGIKCFNTLDIEKNFSHLRRSEIFVSILNNIFLNFLFFIFFLYSLHHGQQRRWLFINGYSPIIVMSLFFSFFYNFLCTFDFFRALVCIHFTSMVDESMVKCVRIAI